MEPTLADTEPSALVPRPGRPLNRRVDLRRLLEDFVAGRNERTRRAYERDLEDFRAFLGSLSRVEAARTLLSDGPGPANALALEYRAHLLERGLSAATINRRLSALRSLVTLARTLGVVGWKLEDRGLKSESYRDTRGPGRDGFRSLLAELSSRRDAKGLRDRAILRLLHENALRRGEVVGLDVEDLDLEGGTVAVLGKGRTGKAKITLPEPTREALRSWFEARGAEPGPLFVNFDRARKGKRLTGSAIYSIVRKLGKAAGIETRPHGLRHAAITLALDKTNGDVRAVARFSRHRDLRVLGVYDDSREDLAGKVARLVASEDSSGGSR